MTGAVASSHKYFLLGSQLKLPYLWTNLIANYMFQPPRLPMSSPSPAAALLCPKVSFPSQTLCQDGSCSVLVVGTAVPALAPTVMAIGHPELVFFSSSHRVL